MTTKTKTTKTKKVVSNVMIETDALKVYRSPTYNYNFDKATGYFERFGKTKADKDDPDYAPFPEIADIEITTACNGINGKLCPFCYKANTPNGTYMTIDTFKTMLDKFPKYIDAKTGRKIYPLSQIAFGVDSECKTNPDVWKIFEHTRACGIIPNVTVANISDETADKLVSLCGAVAVSRYHDKDICYDTINKLTSRMGQGKPLIQVNIHLMLSDETFDRAKETINDILSYPKMQTWRKKSLGSIVFLGLKKCGRGKSYSPTSIAKYKEIVKLCLDNKINFGFDSCSCYKFLASLDDPNKYIQIAEPCESGRMSIYIDVHGKVFPCSFCENMKESDIYGKGESGEFEWSEGLDAVNCTSFKDDIWYNPKIVAWRKKLLTNNKNPLGCIECPMYKV